MVQDEELPSESTSVMFSPSSPSLSLLVSPVSIIDTGSVFTLVFGVELEVAVTVVVVVLFTLFLVPTFPFGEDFLGVVFFANVAVFLGGVASVVVKMASCFLLLTSSNSCLVFFCFSDCVLLFQFFCLFKIFIHEIRETFVSYGGLCLHGVGNCPNNLM